MPILSAGRVAHHWRNISAPRSRQLRMYQFPSPLLLTAGSELVVLVFEQEVGFQMFDVWCRISGTKSRTGQKKGRSERAPNVTRSPRRIRPAADEGAYAPRNLFEQRPQILKHGVFFVRARALGKKELLAQVQCLSLHYRGIKPVL